MAGLTHAKIVSALDPGTWAYSKLQDQKDKKQFGIEDKIETYIFEILVRKIQRLESRIDELESSEADRKSWK